MKLGRDFLLFRFGQLVSLMGDACASIALPWWVLEKTGSAEKMAVIIVPSMIIKVCLLPMLGPIGDKFPRKWVAVLGDSWSGLFTLSIALMAYLDYFNIPLLICLTIISSIGSALFMSVTASIIPQLVTKEHIPEAVRQGQTISMIGTIAGSLLGGTLVAFLGIFGAFLVDGLSFFAAGVASFMIKANTSPAGSGNTGKLCIAKWFAEIQDGLRIVKKVPILIWTAILAGIINFFFAPLGIALPYLIKETRHMEPWMLGVAQATMSFGLLFGSIIVGRLCRHIFEDRLVVAAITFLGFSLAILPFIESPVFICASLFFAGTGLMTGNIPVQARRVMAVPDAYRSRVETIYMFIRLVMAPAGVGVVGILISDIGITITMLICGGILGILSFFLYLIPKFAEFYRSSPEKVGSFIADNYPSAFSSNYE